MRGTRFALLAWSDKARGGGVGMADMNLVRKQGPSLWPWLIGLVVLGLLIWAIAELVNTDRDNKTMAEADSAGGPVTTAVSPGAAAPPATAQGASPAAEQSPEVTPAPLGALMPMGAQDIGQKVTGSGEALTDSDNGGFWLRTENSAVIWVRSTQKVEEGQQVQGMVGTVRAAKAGEPGAALDADLETQASKKGWVFAPGLYLDATPAGSVVSPASATRGRQPVQGTKGRSAKRPATKR